MSGATWIPLPVEFKGIWYSPDYGGFNILLKHRFNPSRPPGKHEFAKPTWMSREEFEERFGRVEVILVNGETWNSDDEYTPDEKDLLIFTDQYVVTMDEYDGWERFVALPRNYRKLLGGKE
jgi:hypothetical protein